MRHRGTTDTVIKWWAEQDPLRGHGYTGTSIRYEGPSLYSWDTEIARIVAGGKIVCYKPESSYWSTTRHIWEARRVWGETTKKLYSMANFDDPEASAEELITRIHARGLSFIAGRGWRAQADLDTMKKLTEELKILEGVFGLDSYDDRWTLPRESEESGYKKYTYYRKIRYYNSTLTWIVPEWIVKGRITAQRIVNTRNAEVRRLATEKKYGITDGDGYEQMFEDLNAKLVHKDECGELYHISVSTQFGGKLALVKVINSTPEADGTRRVFFLKVHPENRPLYPGRRYNQRTYSYEIWGAPQELTARNAVASTFGLTGEQYAPVTET